MFGGGKKMIKSIGQWKKLFYSSVKDAKQWTDKQCFEHILKKYSGVTKKIVQQRFVYPLCFSTREVYISGLNKKHKKPFEFNDTTCSLCKKYINHKVASYKDQCDNCPLAISGNRCGANMKNPWGVFVRQNNPEPMIAMMKKMISQCDSKGKWKPQKNTNK